MTLFVISAFVFAVWIYLQTTGWPKDLNLSLEADSIDTDHGSHGHASDHGGGDGGDGGD